MDEYKLIQVIEKVMRLQLPNVAFKDDLNATLKELKVREKTNEGSKMAQ